jgi:hypothetical protein
MNAARGEVTPGRLCGPLLEWGGLLGGLDDEERARIGHPEAVCSAAWTTKSEPTLAIRNWMVFSLDVRPTREDRWDHAAIVRGFWACRDFES